jgi:hypothetical protein
VENAPGESLADILVSDHRHGSIQSRREAGILLLRTVAGTFSVSRAERWAVLPSSINRVFFDARPDVARNRMIRITALLGGMQTLSCRNGSLSAYVEVDVYVLESTCRQTRHEIFLEPYRVDSRQPRIYLKSRVTMIHPLVEVVQMSLNERRSNSLRARTEKPAWEYHFQYMD